MQRFGERPSCRAKDIYQILERFAAAGIQKAPELEEVARNCLRLKASMEGTSNSASGLDSLLDFHSDRSLLLIWKFSTKQKKQRAFLQSALKHWERHKETGGANQKSKALSKSEFVTQPQEYDWDTMFADPSLPLVVDIGCGMGVSLLGLSSSTDENSNQASSQLLSGNHPLTTWQDCNFVGVDLGALGIGYARSVASRWCLEDRLQFVVDSAEDFVEKVKESYPGPIRLFLIQFPTPYRLKPAETNDSYAKSGNSQLPTSANDGFMVTEKLLRLIHESLLKTNGRLLIQSNCEDVAVGIRNLACKEVGFLFESMSTNVESSPFTSVSVTPRIPQRTADWIAMGGERANGPGWFGNPLLHREGATETEVACALNGTPVHRCLLRPSGNKKAE
jgi:SAM-dependent methyltransferase